jgi:hypothetical protein
MSEPNKTETLLNDFKAYTHTTIELVKLQAIEKVAETGASLLASVIITLAGCMTLLMGSIGLAYFISQYTGNVYCGFFSVAGLYLILLLIFLVGRKSILAGPIRNSLIKKFIK